MPAPESIKQLVARFTDQREDYRSGRYNEAQLRHGCPMKKIACPDRSSKPTAKSIDWCMSCKG